MVKTLAKPAEISSVVFVLIMMTVLAVAAAAVAGTMVHCVVPYLPVFGEQAAVLCSGLSNFGPVDDPFIGVGMAVAVLLAAVITWRLAFKRWLRRRRVETAASLVNNIHRIAEDSPESEMTRDAAAEENPAIWEHLDELEKRIGSSSAGRDVASAWLGLLRTANDLHSEGRLSTDELKMINTRLLDLVSEDADWSRTATPV